MKFNLKTSFNLKLEVERKRSSRRRKKSWMKQGVIFFAKVFAEFIITDLILKPLVALIINIITNGSFYFYNRFFYFGETYG